MMENKYRGEQVLVIGGKEQTLRFTWDAIARLRSEHGEDFDRLIMTAIDSKDVAFLAGVIAVATGLTPKEVMAGSPPLITTGKAMAAALRYAYHGREGKTESQNPPAARRLATWWNWLMRRLSGLD